MTGRRLVPEVVQTSAMDCGPATLAALLGGFGVSASYARLRDACATDVDGTSVDALEDVARQLGLDVAQVMLPVDHVAEAASCPSIVVTSQPGGLTHFVVAWRRHGPLVQVMDPAVGRRWVRRREFLHDVYVHQCTIPAEAFERWARSDALRLPLLRHLAEIGIAAADAGRLVDDAAVRGGSALAALDAAVRLLRATGGPASAARVADLAGEPDLIDDEYWFGRPDGPQTVRLRGAVLVRAKGPAASPPSTEELPETLRAALTEPAPAPGRLVWNRFRGLGRGQLAAVWAGAATAAVGLLAEAALLRTLVTGGSVTGTPVIGALVGLGAALWLLDGWLIGRATRLGRRLERGLRLALVHRLPRLPDRYLRSRPVSDLTERAHRLHRLRELPALTVEAVRCVTTVVLLPVLIGVLDPASALPAVLAAVGATVTSLAFLPAQAERDVRVRSHTGAVSRFYLDALLGLPAVRAHAAEPVIEAEHDRLLGPWTAAMRAVHRGVAVAEAVPAVVGLAFVSALLLGAAGRVVDPSMSLLLAYWAVSVPAAGAALGSLLRRYPPYRSAVLRLLEPLTTATVSAHPVGDVDATIRLARVAVQAGGRTVLTVDDVTIAAGEHVAVVGRSGSGKSTLAGLLLGWQQSTSGEVTVGGEPLDADRLAWLRRHTAWVDPTVTVWNAPLVDNLRYGNDPAAPIDVAIRDADLAPVRDALGDDTRTPLGEGGGLLSGGEAQRVRLGRARLRSDVRLAVLDEPFRGLSRDQRRAILGRARGWWPGATLLFITHDIADTRDFDRVLVVESGSIVEVGSPSELAARADSRYRALLAAESAVDDEFASPQWTRVRVDAGRVARPHLVGPA